MNEKTESGCQPVEPGVLYPLANFKDRIGWGSHSMRVARRAGLRVRYVAGRGFILGDDFIEFVVRSGKDQK